MSYEGWLIKVGNYKIPNDEFIKAESYSVTRNVQDLNSYRDLNGILRRKALKHAPIKVEFETPAMLTDTKFEKLMSHIRENYIISTERKVHVTAFVPELGEYVTQDMYMPDPQTTIYGTYGGKIHYQSIRIAFIGY